MAAPARKPQQQPLEDSTPSRIYHEYDIPEKLWPDAVTADFGAVRTIGMKQLTPLEEKLGMQRSKGDPLIMAFELAKVALGFAIDDAGLERRVHSHDGTVDLLYAQLHPKIRSLIVQAYSEMASPSDRESDSFLKSRRIRA